MPQEKLAVLEKLSKLVLDDIFGDVADSTPGWDVDEDIKQAEKWAIPPPLVCNSYIGTIKCLFNNKQKAINISISMLLHL